MFSCTLILIWTCKPQSTVELASMAPGTMLCDYSLYVCTFLSIAVTNMLAICFSQRKVRTMLTPGIRGCSCMVFEGQL